MSWYKNYRLINEGDGYTLEIYLDLDSTEFSSEFLTKSKESLLGLEDQIRKLIEEKFKDVKVNSAKIIAGTLVVGTLSLVPAAATTQAYAATAVTALDTTGTVTANKLNMRTGPSTDYSVMHVLWQGNVVKVIGQSSGWYQIRLTDGRVGWVSETYLRISSTSTSQQKVDAVISTAQAYLGTPYVYGGNSPSDGGFDCSGFVQYVYGRNGYTLNRMSRDQALNGVAVSRANLQPGDIIFYSLEGNGQITHDGIYLGNGKMIHSPKTGDVVKITDVSTSYWRDRYVTARRIIQ